MSESSIVRMTSTDVEADDELHRRICRGLKMTPEEYAQMTRCAGRVPGLENRCRELAAECEALKRLITASYCPANMNFSQVSVDKVSKETQVNVTEIVKGLGGDYVDNFPVPPGKKIRLIQRRRPGYLPNKIEVDVSLANAGTNYLDLKVQFFLTAAENEIGEAIGPRYAGNQFLNKDGTQIHKPFPEYRSAPLAIGSLELVAVEVTHTGQSNALDSASVRLPYDEKFWAKMCTDAGLCIPPAPC